MDVGQNQKPVKCQWVGEDRDWGRQAAGGECKQVSWAARRGICFYTAQTKTDQTAQSRDGLMVPAFQHLACWPGFLLWLL